MRVAAALAFVLVVSGCLGATKSAEDAAAASTAAEPSPSARSTANTTQEQRPDLASIGKGAVEGTVRDEFEQRVANAHVALLGTSAFVATDASGTFSFPNITAGTYTLRVDHEWFVSLEQKVEVKKGEATLLEVRLVYPVESFPGFLGKPHRHDWWGDSKEIVIMDRYISLGTLGVCATYSVSNGCYAGFLIENAAPTHNYPESRIVFSSPADENERPNIVFEGTGRIRVDINLEGNVLHPYDIRASIPGEPQSRKVLTVSTPKASFELPVFENNTDPPHFRRSGWEFYIDPSKGPLPHPATLFQGRMHWKVTVYRSERELPIGGAHPDYWGTDTVRHLLKKTCNALRTPVATSGCGGVDLPENKTVTIGTEKMVVTLSWTQNLPVPVKIGLEYAGADMTSNTFQAQWHRPVPAEDGATKRVYRIDVRPDQWDSPYVYKSAWLFRHFVDGPEGLGAWEGAITYEIEIHKQ